MSTQNHLDILSSSDINQECVIIVTKENIDSFDHNTKTKCRILKFSSDWSFEDVVFRLSTLDVKNYPMLFIFVIDIKAKDFICSVEFLESSLANFSKSRPIVLQLTSNKEYLTKIYYKDEGCKDFCEVIEETPGIADCNDFSSFVRLYLNGKIDNFDMILEKLPKVQNCSLILRLLRTLKLTDSFLERLVLKVAAYGSKSDLVAAVDGFFDNEGKIQGLNLKNFLNYSFNSTSVLHTAVTNSNKETIKLLIENCTNFIQELLIVHQTEVTTAALSLSQFDVLCDLLKSCDFPFPQNLSQKSAVDVNLQKIIDERKKFHEDVFAEKREEIENFIKINPKIKLAYNVENKSAMEYAQDEKKFVSFYLLKSHRFRNNKLENITEEIAEECADNQTIDNVKKSTTDKHNSALQLAARALIYNRDETNPLEKEQRELIKKWYREIYETKSGSKLIDAVVQCKDLKIIFDFECPSVSF